nr:AAA family ATPase [Latilactobacillus sakei]
MLQSLSIKQFAIIDELEIQFGEGLTVLSGETGAGKSIIIDAIGQLIGMRASSDFVRHGEKKAIIEGIFDIDHAKEAHIVLEQIGIDLSEDFLIVKREIFNSGKSMCRINNTTVTLQDLRKVQQAVVRRVKCRAHHPVGPPRRRTDDHCKPAPVVTYQAVGLRRPRHLRHF